MKTSIALIAAAAVLSLTVSAEAATKKKAAKVMTPPPAVKYISGPNPASPISAGAIVPAGSELFFVSGIPGDSKAGDTNAQTTDSLTKLAKVLTDNGYALSDVVNAKVYLVADPATGKMDFMGMNKAFATFFGTATEPNKPSRVTVQIAALAGPGSLVEIELVAAKAPKK
jgi:enamine deaminase RidA (YjgF/YER057c/UK114 family)